MSLDVVVVTYESAAHLRACLGSLPADARVVVVDNASEDGSADLAAELGATVLRNAENRGFAAAANQGARAGSGELVLFLNPDAVLEPGAVEALPAAFAGDPTLAAASPTLLHDDGSEQRVAWPYPSATATWVEALGLHLVRAPRDESAYLVGTCLCLRRAAFEEVGGFDERFWLYGEDADLGLRLEQAGWDSRVVPGAIARHVGGASGAASGGLAFEHFQRGAELFVAKHEGPSALAVHRVGLLLGSALRLPLLAFGDRSDGGRYATRKAIVARQARLLTGRGARPVNR